MWFSPAFYKRMLNPFEREENHQILFLPDMTATPPQGIRWNVWAAPRYFFLLETFFLFYKNIFVVDERRERTDALDVCPEVGGIRKPRPFFCWRQQTSREKMPSTRDFPIPSSSRGSHTLSDGWHTWCIFWFVNSFQITWDDCHVAVPWLINGHTRAPSRVVKNETMQRKSFDDDEIMMCV